MSVDCQWISKNLEAFFGDILPAEENRLARVHIEGCDHCRAEVQGLNAIDPLIKKYFWQQLATAKAPQRPRLSLIYGAAATALVAILLAVAVRTPPIITSGTSVPASSQLAPTASVDTPRVVKRDEQNEVIRAKPDATIPVEPARKAPPAVQDGNAPAFLVTDPAGYSRTLDDYRGHLLLIGVWSNNHPQSIAGLERLYKTVGSNDEVRVVGVSEQREAKPPNTTFPIAYNQGSQLLGARLGEFVLLDESGSVRLHGSLVTDVENLRKILQSQ